MTFPGTVGVSVNGIPSSCSTPANCTFLYASTGLSTVSGISPTSFSFSALGPSATADAGGAQAAVLTISGSFVNASISNTAVAVGGASCLVTSVSATQIQCNLTAASAKSGSQPVSVSIAPFGLAENLINTVVQARTHYYVHLSMCQSLILFSCAISIDDFLMLIMLSVWKALDGWRGHYKCHASGGHRVRGRGS